MLFLLLFFPYVFFFTQKSIIPNYHNASTITIDIIWYPHFFSISVGFRTIVLKNGTFKSKSTINSSHCDLSGFVHKSSFHNIHVCDPISIVLTNQRDNLIEFHLNIIKLTMYNAPKLRGYLIYKC